MNCWEFMKCGREGDGVNEDELGTCPAYPDKGRRCARIAGTMCDGKVVGTFAKKLGDCIRCDFYNSEHYDEAALVNARRSQAEDRSSD